MVAFCCSLQDYIRCVSPNPSSSDLVLTASYDHTLRLWDMRRSGAAVLELQHEAPVEDLLFFPSGATCVSCGNNWVRVWDLLAGGKLLLSFSNHQKTITSLCFDGTSQRLLSAGLDRSVVNTAHAVYQCVCMCIGKSKFTVWRITECYTA